MPDLSSFTLPSGTTYQIKDAVARGIAAGGLTFQGVTTTALADNSEIAEYTVNDDVKTAANGDLVIYQKKEFIYSSDDSKWHELGDNSAFQALAYKDTASGDYTPAGNVTGEFQGTEATITMTSTPAGTVSITADGTEADENSANNGTTANQYIPEGTVTLPNISAQLETNTTKYVATSQYSGGVVTAGTAAECEFPELNFNVVGENLVISKTEGRFAPNTPTAVTLPEFTEQAIVDGLSVNYQAGQSASFTGRAVTLNPTFSGTEENLSATYTPAGNLQNMNFEGTESTVTVE